MEVLATAIREEKEIRRIHIGKEVKLSLFAYDINLYIENPKDAIRKLVELITKCIKAIGHKIHIQKSLAFLYVNNELSERDIKETIPLIIAKKKKKRIKSLQINLSKEIKDLCAKNYKTLVKKIKDDTDGKIYHVLG